MEKISRTEASNLAINMYLKKYDKPIKLFYDDNLFECVDYVCKHNAIESFNGTNVSTFDVVYNFSEIGLEHIFNINNIIVSNK